MSEEQKDPRAYIPGGRRCAVMKSDWMSGWFVGTSPRNGDNASVEGDWEDWVRMARGILAADEAFRALPAETQKALDEAKA